MGAILLNRVKIGAGSLVGAGALVLERTEIPPGSLVLGSPAKVVKPIGDGVRGPDRQGWRHYVEMARRHRAGNSRALSASGRAMTLRLSPGLLPLPLHPAGEPVDVDDGRL